MNSLGLYLRGLREAKGMSLDDIARSTRVGRRHLEALEGDTPGELPAPVFVKGFIRAYCEFLECPSDHALDLYRESTGEPAPAHGPARPLLSTRSRFSGPLVISIVLFLALGLSLLVLRVGLPSPRKSASPVPVAREDAPKTTPPVSSSAPNPAQVPAPAPVLPAAPEPAATSDATASSAPTSALVTASTNSATPATSVSSSSAGTTAAAETKLGSHHLVVRTIEPTWLRVQVDDGRVAEELLPTGAVREWNATKRFTLTIGNAGGVEIDLNGKRLPSLGASGAVIQRLVLPLEQPGSGS